MRGGYQSAIPSSMTEAREWLAVMRIAGDEKLMETITVLVAHDCECRRVGSRVRRRGAPTRDREL